MQIKFTFLAKDAQTVNQILNSGKTFFLHISGFFMWTEEVHVKKTDFSEKSN